MSLRVFLHSLRQARRALVVLPVASGAFYYLVLLSSSAFLRDVPNVGFFSRPPRAVEAFLGGSVDFLQPVGWLVAAMTHPITLALLTGAGLAVAAGAVATEVERGTIDLVLARPVGRLRFLAAKAAASVVAVTAAEAGGLAGVLIARPTVESMDEVAVDQVLRSFLASWILFAALAMVAILVSSASSLRSRAVGVSVGLVVAWFFANFIALLIDGISGMRYASPFHYFRPADIVTGRPMGVDLLVLAGVGVAALAAAVWRFRARDLTR